MKIREKDISLLCKITREIFMEQPVFLELEAPIKICGKFDPTRNLSYALQFFSFTAYVFVPRAMSHVL